MPETTRIRCRQAADGSLLYMMAFSADALPQVLPRDLDAAWDGARRAAMAGLYGPARRFRFRADGQGVSADLTLADPDACCWAAAVDAITPLTRPHGISLCLRLMALIDMIGRWAASLCVFEPDGATLHPALLEAAARAPLTRQGGLAENSVRAHLARLPAARPRRAAPDRGPA